MRDFKSQLNEYQHSGKPSKTTAEQLSAIANILGKKPDLPDFIFMFGKYKGESMADISAKDPNYLRWLLSEDWVEEKPRLKQALEATLKFLGDKVLQ